MEDRQPGHAPEHEILATSETEEALSPPATGQIHQGLFTLPAHLPMTADAHGHLHDPGHFFYQLSSPASVLESTASYYAPSSELISYPADHSWQQAGHQTMFPLLASEAVAGATGVASDAGNAGDARGNDASLPNMLSYLPYGEVQQRGLQAEEYPSSFEQSFVAPQNNQQQTPYVYDWNAQGIQTAGLGLASVYPEAGQDDKTTSPVETESGTFTPSSIRSTSSAGQFSSLYTGTANIDYQLAATAANETLFAPSSSAGKGLSAAKRGKAKQKPKPSGNSSGKGKLKRASPAIKSSSSGESSLSGAGPSSSHENQPSSRAVAPANAKSVEKRRGKSKSHNLVETQYRERLTEQFDRLRSALPQPSESLQASGSGTGSGVEPRAVAAAEERRTSKAEVLEMARNHIQDLEQRRDDLVRQKVELESTSQRLRQIYASHSLGQGQTGGPQPMFDDDEEEQEEQGENIG